MRIGIDVRYLSHGLVGGVHTYLAHFVPALLPLAKRHQIFLYADTKRPFELSALPPHVTVRRLPWHGPLSSIRHDLFMHRQMAADGLDVVHFPANHGFGPAGARTVITLHDAINILPLREIIRGHPKRPTTIAMMVYLHLLTTMSLRRAALVLTVSEHAKGEIVRHGHVRPEVVVPVPHAPTPDLRRIDDPAILEAVRRRHGLTGTFVLADAIKNPATLVQAWRLLPPMLRAGRQIVFFSRRPSPPPIVREAVTAGDALLLTRPSRADLIALYSMAEAFVFPSWGEGFGIPLLEAMMCGAPVIASDRGAIPEVTGGVALLADADDASAFSRHLAALLDDPERAARMRAHGLAHAARYSWHETARRILDGYERVASSAPRRAGHGERGTAWSS
jgi:glycosyltransferase involved in cell wall biosynthesis